MGRSCADETVHRKNGCQMHECGSGRPLGANVISMMRRESDERPQPVPHIARVHDWTEPHRPDCRFHGARTHEPFVRRVDQCPLCIDSDRLSQRKIKMTLAVMKASPIAVNAALFDHLVGVARRGETSMPSERAVSAGDFP